MPQKIFTDAKALEEELKKNRDKWTGKIITFMDRGAKTIQRFRIVKIADQGVQMQQLPPPNFPVAA